MTTAEIVTIILSLISLGVSIYVYMKSVYNEKKKMAIEAYIQLQESLFFLYEYGCDEIKDFVTDREDEEYKTLSSCLGRIEIFATGVIEGVYDFKTVYRMSHGYLDIALREKIEYLIEYKKAKDFYSNTLLLLKRMDKKT